MIAAQISPSLLSYFSLATQGYERRPIIGGKFCIQLVQVHSIRDAAANNLKHLAEEFGPEWALQHIIPQLAPVMGSEITCSKLLPVVVTASKDRVPNIKFNMAKVL